MGDYAKDTADITLLEHGVYAIMLDHYYLHEKPLPADQARLCRICGAMTAAERKAVKTISAKFFRIDGDQLRNKRADLEIANYHERGEINRRNGSKGGRPRKNENPEKTQSVISGLRKPPVLETEKKPNSEIRIQNEEIQEEGEAPSCSEPSEADVREPDQQPAMCFLIRGPKNKPRDWPLYHDRIADFQECYPGIDAMAEAKKARQWCIANETKRKTAKGMLKFLNNWMARAQDDAAKFGTGTTRPSRSAGAQSAVSRERDRMHDQAGILARYAAEDDSEGIREGDDPSRRLEAHSGAG